MANNANSKNAYLFLEIRDILFNGVAIFLSQRRADEKLSHAIPLVGLQSEDIVERDAERNWQFLPKLHFLL